MPEGTSYEQCMLVEPLSVGTHTLRRCGLKPGETVVILGLGSIGLSAIAAAKHLGAGKIIGSAKYQHQAAIGRKLGADLVLGSRENDVVENVMSETEFAEKTVKEAEDLKQIFVQELTVDETIAEILCEAGFSTIDEVAYVPEEELLAIEEFDEELVHDLQERANSILLTKALTSEEKLGGTEPAQDLLDLSELDRHMAYVLASRGIVTRDDLAECAVDDLIDIEGLDQEQAGKIIMQAREHWFTSPKDD